MRFVGGECASGPSRGPVRRRGPVTALQATQLGTNPRGDQRRTCCIGTSPTTTAPSPSLSATDTSSAATADAAKQIAYLSTAVKTPRIRDSAARLADQARGAGWSDEDSVTAKRGVTRCS